MAKADFTIGLTDEFSSALAETRKELEAAKEALSEERIRAIVREELATWEKSLPLRIRAGMGWPAHIEVK